MTNHAKATSELEGGTIVLPKRISLVVATAIAIQLAVLIFHYATSQATATGSQQLADSRIARLELEVSAVKQLNDRTIRIEEAVVYIKATLDRLAKR